MRRDITRPRIVIVTRRTPLELLLERHGTLEQARFYVESRGGSLDWQRALHDRLQHGLELVQQALPADQRRVRVDRSGLDRFLFAPDDVVVIVGQDGLVPNAAKYLTGQLTIGVNPDPEHYEGVLCCHRPDQLPHLLGWLETRDPAYRIEPRTMAVAMREDGQQLLALNDIFIGHRSHQSARYRLQAGQRGERQSSSGVIVSTGTGSTGWARSIATQRHIKHPLPQPSERRLVWFVREPWPSVATGAKLTFADLDESRDLRLYSEMGEGGVVFADGMESDWLEFVDGQEVAVRIADEALNLVVPQPPTNS